MILKSLLSSHLQKPARTILLLFSIAVCSSLMFANEGFRETCEQMVYEAGTRFAGQSELYITPKQSVGAPEWIDMDIIDPFSRNFEYVYGFIRGKALYAPDSDKMSYFTIMGVDINQFNHHNPLTLKTGDVSDWSGNKLVVK